MWPTLFTSAFEIATLVFYLADFNGCLDGTSDYLRRAPIFCLGEEEEDGREIKGRESDGQPKETPPTVPVRALAKESHNDMHPDDARFRNISGHDGSQKQAEKVRGKVDTGPQATLMKEEYIADDLNHERLGGGRSQAI